MDKQQKIEELEKRLSMLNDKIKDVEDRLPAHGIKPPIMTELFELEDEREAVLDRLKNLRETQPGMEPSEKEV
jgi:hypothetical protein